MAESTAVLERRPLAAPALEAARPLEQVWPLALAGLAIEAVYLFAVIGPFSLLVHGGRLTDLGGLTDHQPVAGIMVTVGLVVLFALYGWAIQRLRDSSRAALAIVLGGTLVFSATLVFLYPVTAMDVYNYAVQGHVVTFDRLNPLVTAPSTVQGDSFISYGGSWAESTSPYGPIWIGVSALDAVLVGSDVIKAVLVLKAVSALGVMATTALLALAASRWGDRAALAAALFGWNPLIQLEMVGNGHNDAVMIALLVIALMLLAARKAPGGALALAASVFVKYLTVVAVPFYLLEQIARQPTSWRKRVRRIVTSIAVLALASVVAYAPFWTGPATLERVRQVDANYLASLPALAILYLPDTAVWLLPARIGLVAIVALWQAWELLHRRSSVERAVFETYFAVLLVATHFAGWYIPLLLAVGILSADGWLVARAITFSFSSILTTPLWMYVWPLAEDKIGLAGFHLIVVPLAFLPPLAIIALSLVRSKRPPLDVAPDVLGQETIAQLVLVTEADT